MSDTGSVVAYLTEEISELVRLGPIHSYTWVSHTDPGRWLQVSVHDGATHYLTLLCVLPLDIDKDAVDRLLGKVGRKQPQANQGMCLVYYLGQSDDAAALLDQAPLAAQQCAAIAGLLWKADKPEHLQLLGARGPRLPYVNGASASTPALPPDLDALPE